MALGERLSAGAWRLRKLASRAARYIYVFVLLIIIVPAIALRVESTLFERRAIATVRALSTLQVGVTSRTEAVARMQALGFVTRQYGPPVCFEEECLSLVIPNSRLSSAVFLPLTRSVLYSALTWWGLRFSSLSVDVHFNSGKVSFSSYELMLSSSSFDFGDDAIVVRVQSQGKLLGQSEGAAYRIETSGESHKTVRIALTPNTSPELVNPAFDLRLRCLRSLTGCRTWGELLPRVGPT
jgi:hypothetical protein